MQAPPPRALHGRRGGILSTVNEQARCHPLLRTPRRAHRGADHRARLSKPLHAARRRGAVCASDRQGSQQGDQGALRRRRDAGRDARAGRGAAEGAHQDHRPLQHEGEERDRPQPGACREARRQRAQRSCGARGAPRRRPQDRERGAQHGLRRAHDRRRHPYFPACEPQRPRTGKDAARGRGRPQPRRARALQAARAPLADPAWPLCLQGANAGLPGLRRPANSAATRPRRSEPARRRGAAREGRIGPGRRSAPGWLSLPATPPGRPRPAAAPPAGDRLPGPPDRTRHCRRCARPSRPRTGRNGRSPTRGPMP